MALTLMKFRIRIDCRRVGEACFTAQSIIERAVARGKAREEPSQLPRIGMANDAVDKVRRGEHKRLLKDEDDRLKGRIPGRRFTLPWAIPLRPVGA